MHTLETVAARAEIFDVLNRYGVALDTRDWDLLRTCFSADATMELPGRVLDGRDAIMAFLQTVSTWAAWQQHLIGNHQVAVNGERARGTCSLYATQFPIAADEPPRTTLATFADEFRATDEGWRIVRREMQLGRRLPQG